MPPLPKKKHSRARKGGRAAHFRIRPQTVVQCEHCYEVRLPHRLCESCGYYGDRQVLVTEDEA